MRRSPALAYIAPFAVFMGAMYLHLVVPLAEVTDQIVRIAVPAIAIALFSRRALDFRVAAPWATIVVGLAVFIVWIGPDLVSPGYRHHWWFQNAILGAAHTTLSEAARSSAVVLALRTMRAALVVPIVEELFWRAWLMRWLISPAFEKIPLGAYQPAAFWLCAVLFASEHGPYWDVGLAAGVVYNWWMIRTRSLGDLMLAHAITNLSLSIYAIAAGKWEYWL